jgi:23S rRNA (uracil1939-C5)-methyltransferase
MPVIEIERLAFGGSGFGHIDGKACFVPMTAPGDIAEVNITKDKKSFSVGELLFLRHSSEKRVVPPCKVFGLCGGCNWQHIDYGEQCREKEQILREILWRSARVEGNKIKPIIPSDSPFYYRNRVQLKVNLTDGNLSLGFYRSGSHYVIDVQEGCCIAREEINLVIPEVRALILNSPEPDRIPQVDISVSFNGGVTALFHYIGHQANLMESYLLSQEKLLSNIKSLYIQTGRKETLRKIQGDDYLNYQISLNGKVFQFDYTADSFSQVNFKQNQEMVRLVYDTCLSLKPRKLLDLYCGNGNFSIPLASIVDEIRGIESFDKSIMLAKQNVEKNKISNAVYLCEDAVKGIKTLVKGQEKFDLVILDPPRTGALELIKHINLVKPEKIIYISCNPPTLGRDLSILIKSGFVLNSIQPFDMFPHTYHIETVTILESK